MREGKAMRKTILTICIIVIAVVNSAGLAASSTGGPVDHSSFAVLLERHVENGRVNYYGIKEDVDLLDQYLRILKSVEPETLSRNEQMAFYINTYNAWTIKLILTKYPDITSIKDLGSLFESPWKKKLVQIENTIFTLDEIEHGILRPVFRDPRIHFAVNCASKGCPPLQNTPFTGMDLDSQLDRAAQLFINNPEFNHLRGNTLYVSKIFKWFHKDFNDDIVGFFKQYARGKLKEALEKNKEKLKVRYLEYDWSLNAQ